MRSGAPRLGTRGLLQRRHQRAALGVAVAERPRQASLTDGQIVALTLAIVAINGWNRLNVAFRVPASDADKGRASPGGLRSLGAEGLDQAAHGLNTMITTMARISTSDP